jgi:hypothetical protein
VSAVEVEKLPSSRTNRALGAQRAQDGIPTSTHQEPLSANRKWAATHRRSPNSSVSTTRPSESTSSRRIGIATRSSDENRTTPFSTECSKTRPSRSVRRTRAIPAPASSTVPPARNPFRPQFPPRFAQGRPRRHGPPLPPATPCAVHRLWSSREATTVQCQGSVLSGRRPRMLWTRSDPAAHISVSRSARSRAASGWVRSPVDARSG